MAKHIWLIYPCLKEFICASKIECKQYEEDKDEKSYQGKYFINEMLVIQRF